MTLPLRDRSTLLGGVAIAGGGLGLLLAPVMVVIKYMTGWAVVSEPAWVDPVQQWLGRLLLFAPPTGLWTVYGSGYTVALLLMFAALVGFGRGLRDERGRVHSNGYWILLAGLLMVIPGDAIHTWTWHQNGLTIPTPGTNPLANAAYAVHMMGMNVVLIGAMTIGISALRRKFLASWLAWSLTLAFPAAALASVTVLPTTPSGALWWLCAIMIACGYCVATGRSDRLQSATRGRTA